MKPRIEVLPEKRLIGKSLRMSLANNKTAVLWKHFMQNRSTILNNIGDDLFSIQIYDETTYLNGFNLQSEFTKWACIEVADFKNIPNGFYSLTLPKGLYALFQHKGPPSEFPKTMQFILGHWLPNSDYMLDHRPHFELLGPKYKNNHPDSEEEVWIPIKN